jgi:hypothetical protein
LNPYKTQRLNPYSPRDDTHLSIVSSDLPQTITTPPNTKTQIA